MKYVMMPEKTRYQRLFSGSFSKIQDSPSGHIVAVEWLYCREYFQEESKGISRFLFCHRMKKTPSIAYFLDKVEEILGLEDRTIVGPTQRFNISWIRASRWWMDTSMKRSLLTLLLRCAQNYKPKFDNFEEALFSTSYSKRTEYALRRFLDGNTRYVGRRRGWLNQFKCTEDGFVNTELFDRLLIRPDANPAISSDKDVYIELKGGSHHERVF